MSGIKKFSAPIHAIASTNSASIPLRWPIIIREWNVGINLAGDVRYGKESLDKTS